MVCKNCGKHYQGDATVCAFCGAEIVHQLEDNNENPTENLGFARPGSDYIKSEIIYHSTKENSDEPIDSFERVPVYAENQATMYRIRKDEYRDGNAYLQNYVKDDKNNYADRAEIIQTDANEGTLQAQEENVSTERKSGTLTKYKSLILCSSIIIITVGFVLLFFVSRDQKEIPSYIGSDALEVIEDEENSTIYIFNTDGEVRHKLKGNLVSAWNDPTFSTILFKHKIDDTLCFVDANTNYDLENNKMTITADFYGNIFYTSNKDNGINQMVLYNKKTDTHTVLEEDEKLKYVAIANSPDGKTYAYTKAADFNFLEKFTSYVSINGEKATLFVENTMILAISDDGAYIYYIAVKEDGTFDLCVKTKEGITVLTNAVKKVFFNQDLTEILYTGNNGTFAWFLGNDPVKVSDSEVLELITPKNSIKNYIYGGIIYHIDTFKNKVISCNNMLRFINYYYEGVTLATVSDVLNAGLSRDWDSLLFKNINGELTKITNLAGENLKSSLATDVVEFYYSGDFAQVYYTKLNRNESISESRNSVNKSSGGTFPLYHLYYCDEKGNSKVIDIETTDVQINEDGSIIFFLKSNETGGESLYYSKNGESVEALEDLAISDLVPGRYGIWLRERTDAVNRYNLYYNKSGTEFKALLEDIFIMPNKNK